MRCIDGINQWLIDIVNPGEEFSLFDWISAAKLAMDDIWSRGKLPIVVGGTGLYIQALVEGFSLQQISNFQFPISHSSLSLRALPSESKTNQIPIRQMADKNQKKSVIAAPDQVEGKTPAGIQVAQSKQLPGSPGTTLKNTAGPEDDTILLKEKYSRGQLNSLTIEQLNNILKDLDPVAFETVDKRNSRRLIRAIELAQEGLRPVKIKPDFEVLQIAIDLPRRELHERIDRRVDERFEQGMLREVIGLLKRGVDPEWLVGLGLEYREITEYLTSKNQEPRTNQILNYKYQLEAENWNLNGGCNLGVLNYEYGLMVQKLKFRIHQYARRQITWFKRFPEINWLSDYNEIKRFMKIFLEH
ncbi:MAG: tRNA dimethylallyltransferase [Patescibacteria group bacterium]